MMPQSLHAPPLVVGIIGKKGSGKDTLADTMEGFKKYSLSHPIKETCKYLFHLTEDQLHDPLLKEKPLGEWGGKTPRQILQWFGTDIMREQFDSNFWIRHAERVIGSCRGPVVVPDIRFLNEAEFIRSFPNSILIKIERPTHTHGNEDTHISEKEGSTIPEDWIQHHLVNDTGLDVYLAQCKNLVKKIKKKM